MSKAVRISWAKVEFQRDLRNPSDPVRLGVIIVGTLQDRPFVALIGREPTKNNPPSELKEVGPLGFSQLIGWTGTIFQDIHQAHQEQRDLKEIFAFLSSRWRWNLYVTDADEEPVKAGETPRDVASRLYERFVGEPFSSAGERRHRHARPKVPTNRRRMWAPAEVTVPFQA